MHILASTCLLAPRVQKYCWWMRNDRKTRLQHMFEMTDCRSDWACLTWQIATVVCMLVEPSGRSHLCRKMAYPGWYLCSKFSAIIIAHGCSGMRYCRSDWNRCLQKWLKSLLAEGRLLPLLLLLLLPTTTTTTTTLLLLLLLLIDSLCSFMAQPFYSGGDNSK